MTHTIPSHHLYSDSPGRRGDYSAMLHEQDNGLSPALEEILRDIILADPSDYGIDLAIAKIYATYHPGTQKWEKLHYPNDRWLTCGTEAIMDQPSQEVHINLVNGELRVVGRPLSGLPDAVKDSPEFERIFCDVCITTSAVNKYS